MAQHDEELQRLHRQLGDINVPPSFKPNKGWVSCKIPNANRALVVPRFIQRLGTGEVKMVVGRSSKEAVYVTKLFLKPNYSCSLINPMAPWFLQLLGGPSAGFNTLAKATYDLDTWEPHTEIMRYCACKEECRIIEAEISKLTS